VLASGLAIDTRLVPEHFARERILGLLPGGVEVFRSGPVLVVVFPEPRRLMAATALGVPLVRHGQLLAASPLEPDEQKQLDVSGAALVLVSGGRATSARMETLAKVDVALWVDVSDFVLVADVRSLGVVESEPRPAAVETPADVRESLGVAPRTKEAEQVLQWLRHHAGGSGVQPAPSVARTGGTLRERWRFVRSLWTAWRRLSNGVNGVNGGAGPARRSLAVTPQEGGSAGESWLSRVKDTLQHLAARVLLWSRLAPLVGRRQAEYLVRMLEMFDSNALDEALRHAIPLSSELEGALRPPSLTTPSPRTTLAIVPARARASSSLGLGPDLFEDLKQRYRRAFDHLVKVGDIEKAAFVLTELLNSNEEAVSFLERHERFRLAAEVAEARGLPAGVVVRQWFLAGERERAVRIARRTGAFADAVVRLERSHRNAGQALRLLWADALATSGAYAAAVDAVWPVPAARSLVLDWLERAIGIGGHTGARMLARKARLLPSSFPETRERALALLRDVEADSGSMAQAFGWELLVGETTDETRVLARATARRLLPETGDRDLGRLVDRLLDVCGDPVLRADVRASGLDGGTRSRSRIQVRAFARTLVGQARSRGQDASIATPLEGPPDARERMEFDGDGARGVILGVFDGNGDRAAELVARTAADWLRSEFAGCGGDVGKWARSIAVALQQASGALFRAAIAAGGKMRSCTATLGSLSGSTLLVGQVGTTRGYVLRGGKLVQVTRDHSLLNEYLDESSEVAATLTREQVEELPPNVITRSLGFPSHVEVDITRVELQKGDVILLCSDGLWTVLDETAMCKALVEGVTPEAACNALVSLALGAGATDDIAVVVARVQGKGMPSRGPGPVAHARFVPPAILEGEEQSIPPLRSRKAPLELRRLAADRGAMPVLDAAELPDGRMLVALGEVGVWLLSREGRVLTRFSEPTSRIVISDHGDRALLLARRGEVYRVARLDLVTGRVRPWCDARFELFAPDFDGSIWFVARGDTVHAIDATSEPWEHLWKVREAGTVVGALGRDASRLSVWFAETKTAGEVWTYELPELKLRRRQSLDKGDTRLMLGVTSAGATFVGWHIDSGGDPFASVFTNGAWRPLGIPALSHPETPCASGDWIAVPTINGRSTTIHLVDPEAFQTRLRLELEGSARSSGVRFQGEHLVAFDGGGRVVVVSLKDGAVVREFRVS
jgi:serine/threonine protein phosphatase PrpC